MSNHQAIVARVTEVLDIYGADRVQISVVLGEQCVTHKGVKRGDVGILFPADLQLSEKFCHENNLNRDKSLNKDTSKAGFFESNRRVRAQPFLKIRSEALFMPLDSVSYTGVNVDDLVVGFTFDSLNGFEICKKFLNKEKESVTKNQVGSKKKKHLVPDFLEHVDTAHFKYSVHRINEGDILFFHSKRHGTSGRSGYQRVYKSLGKFQSLANKISNAIFGKSIYDDFEWKYVTGSRRVVLDDSKFKNGFHGSNDFRFDITESLKPYLKKGYTFYYEIVGFVNGSSIMPKHDIRTLKDNLYLDKYGDEITYSYGCKEHEYKVFIYRITTQDEDGVIRDLSQRELEEFCKARELGYTLEIHAPVVYDGDEVKLRALVEELTERWDCLTEDHSDPRHLSEGIIIRVENGKTTPLFLKSKSYAFRVCEGHETVGNLEDES